MYVGRGTKVRGLAYKCKIFILLCMTRQDYNDDFIQKHDVCVHIYNAYNSANLQFY